MLIGKLREEFRINCRVSSISLQSSSHRLTKFKIFHYFWGRLQIWPLTSSEFTPIPLEIIRTSIVFWWFQGEQKLINSLKVGLSPFKKYLICFNESPLKIMKNAFCLILKALFSLKIFKFLFLTLWSRTKNGLIRNKG